MTTFLRRLASRLLAVLAALIIGTAALSLVARLALPQADLFRDRIGDALGQMLGAQVSMGRVDARLRGFAPQFTLRDVRLRDRDSGELLLALRELQVDLDLSASLREGAPRVDGVTLVGANLEVLHDTDGRILVRGLDKLRGNDPGARAFFFRRGRFSLANSTLHWTDRQAGVPTVHLSVARLDLHNRYQRHLLRISARPLGETLGDLTVLADLSGSPHRMGDWSGELYLRWQGQDLAQLLRGRLPAGLAIASERVDIESWSRLDTGRPVSALTRLELGGVLLRRQPDPDRKGGNGDFDLGDVGLLAAWQPTADGWQLQLKDVALVGSKLPRATLDFDRLSATAKDAPDTPRQRLSGTVRSLPLAILPRLAPMAAMLLDQPPSATQGLRRFDLAGQARDLRYQLDLGARAGSTDSANKSPTRALDHKLSGAPARSTMDWQVQGAIDGLRIDQCSPEPGSDAEARACAQRRTRLEGLDLIFEAGPGGGYVGLDGRSVKLDPTPALGGKLDLTTLSGDLQWRLDADGVLDLWADAVTADTADIDTETSLKAQLYTFGASPVIDLHTRLEDGRPGNYDTLGNYLPVGIMDDGLERWLLRAIRAGTLTSGEVGFHGRLRDFPNGCGNGHFALTLNLSGGELDYLPPRQAPDDTVLTDAERTTLLGWPPIRDVDASIRFLDRALTIDVTRGVLRNTRLTSGSASIEDLWRPDTMSLTGQATGPVTDGLWLLKNTPLSRNLAGVADAFDVTGDARLELELQIPLKKRAVNAKPLPVGFDGTLLFDGKPTLTPKALPLTVTGLNGRMRFDSAGVHAQDIAAMVDGQPIRIGLTTEQSTEQEGRTRIEIAGRSKIEDLSRRFPSPLWTIADGRADWTLDLSLNNADMQLAAPPLNIELASDLRGVALSPPAPFGKRANEARPLRVTTAFTGGWPIDLRLDFDVLGALLQLQRPPGTEVPELERASFVIGAKPEALPGPRGILIGGRLDEVDLAPWLAWTRDADALFGAKDAADTEAESRLSVLPSSLKIGQVSFGALRLSDLDLRFSPRAGGWSIGFEGGGNGGSVDLPPAGSDGTLRVRLNDLDLQPFTEPDPSGQAQATDDDPRNIGRLALTIESLRFADDLLGRALLSIEPTSGGVRFSEINLEGPLLRATGSGQWTIDATDYVQTEIRADAQSEDFGRLLNALDTYSDVQGAPADAKLSLSWPGGPQRFSLERARGSLRMELGAGRLLAVDPGVGRMLGLVNLSALTRRLALDFTDVTDPGFGFDSIRGNVSIGSGQARIGQFELLSSTADIRITGVTNLIDRTLDQQVRVTPKVGSSVALAGAVAGGPLVGAAVLLADKVAGGAFDRIGRQDYRVTGPWAEPKIEWLSPSAGNGGTLSARSPSSGQGTQQGIQQNAQQGIQQNTQQGIQQNTGTSNAPNTALGSPAPIRAPTTDSTSGKGQGSPAPEAANPFLEGF